MALLFFGGYKLFKGSKSEDPERMAYVKDSLRNDSLMKVNQVQILAEQEKKRTDSIRQADSILVASAKNPKSQAVASAKSVPSTGSSKPKGENTGKTASKTFPNGDRYVGEMKDGTMHGLGTYYYAEKQQISKKDLKKRVAEAGDYIIGEWFEGNVVSGKFYGSNNSLKEVIIIGR